MGPPPGRKICQPQGVMIPTWLALKHSVTDIWVPYLVSFPIPIPHRIMRIICSHTSTSLFPIQWSLITHGHPQQRPMKKSSRTLLVLRKTTRRVQPASQSLPTVVLMQSHQPSFFPIQRSLIINGHLQPRLMKKSFRTLLVLRKTTRRVKLTSRCLWRVVLHLPNETSRYQHDNLLYSLLWDQSFLFNKHFSTIIESKKSTLSSQNHS